MDERIGGLATGRRRRRRRPSPAASTAHRLRNESTEAEEAADNRLAVARALPTDATERNDPAEPMLSTLPTDPMLSTEPWQPMDSTEPVDHRDHTDRREPGPDRASPVVMWGW
jgi:hypothetical protein